MTIPDDVGILTLVLAVATLVAWTALELFYVWGGQPSISEQIWTLFRAWPTFGVLFALVVGLLMGHWFWTR